MFDWIKNIGSGIKNQLLEKFIKGYVVEYIKRQKGFVMFGGLLMSALQVAAALITSPEGVGAITILINAFSDTFTGVLQPNEITLVATSLMALYGAFGKLIKAVKGVPQVPTIIVDKEVLKESVSKEVLKEVAPQLLKK